MKETESVFSFKKGGLKKCWPEEKTVCHGVNKPVETVKERKKSGSKKLSPFVWCVEPAGFQCKEELIGARPGKRVGKFLIRVRRREKKKGGHLGPPRLKKKSDCNNTYVRVGGAGKKNRDHRGGGGSGTMQLNRGGQKKTPKWGVRGCRDHFFRPTQPAMCTKETTG